MTKQTKPFQTYYKNTKSKKPFNKPLFSDFLKEYIETEEMTNEQFAEAVGINCWVHLIPMLNDGLDINDWIYTALDKYYGLSKGYHKRLSKLCYWTWYEDD